MAGGGGGGVGGRGGATEDGGAVTYYAPTSQVVGKSRRFGSSSQRNRPESATSKLGKVAPHFFFPLSDRSETRTTLGRLGIVAHFFFPLSGRSKTRTILGRCGGAMADQCRGPMTPPPLTASYDSYANPHPHPDPNQYPPPTHPMLTLTLVLTLKSVRLLRILCYLHPNLVAVRRHSRGLPHPMNPMLTLTLTLP